MIEYVIAQWLSEQRVCALIINETGQCSTPTEMALHELVTFSAKRSLILLIPGNVCRVVNVEVPAVKTSERLRIIPYTLEDQLIDEVSDNHFALLAEYENSCDVAIIKRAWLRNVLDQFVVKPERVLPDFLALPNHSMLQQGNHILIRNELAQGLATDINLLSVILPNRQQYQQMPVHEHYLTLLAPGALRGNYNLLQGEFKIKKAEQTRRWWQWCATLTALWLFLGLGVVSAQVIYYHHQSSKLNAEIKAMYQKFFPQATSVVSPKARISQALATGGSKQDLFLSMATQVATALQKNPGIALQQFSFQSNVININLRASELSVLESLTQSLRATGLQVVPQIKAKETGFGADFKISAATTRKPQ